MRRDYEMNKEDLLSKGYRKYSGEEIEVYFSKDISTHSGNCVRTMPKVFDTKRKPWILADNGEADSAMKTIDLCPSGALQYINKKDDK